MTQYQNGTKTFVCVGVNDYRRKGPKLLVGSCCTCLGVLLLATASRLMNFGSKKECLLKDLEIMDI